MINIDNQFNFIWLWSICIC